MDRNKLLSAAVLLVICLFLGAAIPNAELVSISAEAQFFVSQVPQVNQTKLISGLRVANITAPVLVLVEKVDYKTNNSIELIDSSLDNIILTKPIKVEAKIFENVTGIFIADTFNQTVVTTLTQTSAIGNLYLVNKENFTAKYGITTQLENLNATDLMNKPIKIDQIAPVQNLIASYSIKKDPTVLISFDWKNIELNSKEILFDINNTLEFKICLNNTSPIQLNNVKIIIPIPNMLFDYQNFTVGGTQLISVEPENFVYDSVVKTLTWNGTIAPNSKAELSFRLKIKPSGLKWPLDTNSNFFLNSSISYNSNVTISGLKIKDIVGNDFYLILIQNKTYFTSENLKLNVLVQSTVLKDLADYAKSGIKIHDLSLAYLNQTAIDTAIKIEIFNRTYKNKQKLTDFLNNLTAKAQKQINETEYAISKNSTAQAILQLELAKKYFALEKYEWSYTNALGAEVLANPNKESEAKEELKEYYRKADVELKWSVRESTKLNDYLDKRVIKQKLSNDVADQLKFYDNLSISILTKAINYVENKLTQLEATIPIHRFFELPKIGFASAQEIPTTAGIEIKVIEKAVAKYNQSGEVVEVSAFGEIWIWNKESYSISNFTIYFANYSVTNLTGSIYINQLNPGWNKVALYSILNLPALELKESWSSKTVKTYLNECLAKGWISNQTAQTYNSSRILFGIDNSLLLNVTFKNSADFNLTNLTAFDSVPDEMVNVSLIDENASYNAQSDSLTISEILPKVEVPIVLAGLIESSALANPELDYVTMTKKTTAVYSTKVEKVWSWLEEITTAVPIAFTWYDEPNPKLTRELEALVLKKNKTHIRLYNKYVQSYQRVIQNITQFYISNETPPGELFYRLDVITARIASIVDPYTQDLFDLPDILVLDRGYFL
ncbi:MAG: hypothetical protein HY929_05775, partial [Euryarchaeota archaeon]|nr:hypothetical protein [Euryarchaeota archaeon]